MEKVKLNIKGMSCGHCVNAVEKALRAVPGATLEAVSIGSASVSYDPTKTKPDDLVKAVDEAGYDAAVAAG